MGALTFKNFPFILRGWNLKFNDSIGFTSSFDQKTAKHFLNIKYFTSSTNQPLPSNDILLFTLKFKGDPLKIKGQRLNNGKIIVNMETLYSELRQCGCHKQGAKRGLLFKEFIKNDGWIVKQKKMYLELSLALAVMITINYDLSAAVFFFFSGKLWPKPGKHQIKDTITLTNYYGHEQTLTIENFKIDNGPWVRRTHEGVLEPVDGYDLTHYNENNWVIKITQINCLGEKTYGHWRFFKRQSGFLPKYNIYYKFRSYVNLNKRVRIWSIQAPRNSKKTEIHVRLDFGLDYLCQDRPFIAYQILKKFSEHIENSLRF